MSSKRVERVLTELVASVPPALHEAGLTPNACVLASRLGVEALRGVRIRARPLAVRATVANPRYTAAAERGELHDDAAVKRATAEGAWCVVALGATGEVGHVVVVVQERYLLDLTAGQMARPERGIAARPFWTLAPELARGGRWGGVAADGCGWSYEARPDDKRFLRAPAWSAYRVRVCGGRVVSERFGARPEPGIVPRVIVPLPVG